MTKLSSSRTLHAAFIVTALALAACGGRTQSEPSDGGASHGDGAPSQADAQSDGACTGSCDPAPERCPIHQPLGGGPCAHEGFLCSYDDDCASIGTVTYRCSGGRWLRGPNGGTSYPCPAVRPAEGDTCFACGGDYPDQCVYSDCVNGHTQVAVCDRGTLDWTMTDSICHP